MDLDEMWEWNWIAGLVGLFDVIVNLAECAGVDGAHHFMGVGNGFVGLLDVWFAVMFDQFVEGGVVEQEDKSALGKACATCDFSDRHASSEQHRNVVMCEAKAFDYRVKCTHLLRTLSEEV